MPAADVPPLPVPLLLLPALEAPTPAGGDSVTEATPLPLRLPPKLLVLVPMVSLLLVPLRPLPVPNAPMRADGGGDTEAMLLLAGCR